AHDDYLRHEAEAQQLAPRRQRAAATAIAAREAATAHMTAANRYDATAAAVDLSELDRLDRELHRLEDEVAPLRGRSRGHQDAIDALNRQIVEAQGWVAELSVAQAARDETEMTFSLLHYCRDTIKEAGPFVMRALLREISATANRIFGEIMGDRSATLTWAE